MLPFLKNRDDGVAQGPVETIRRKPDEGEDDYSMLDAVAEDILAAIERKDKKLLKEALSALVEHIESSDEDQDEQMLGAK